MKQFKIFVSLFLVLTLLFGCVCLSSCSLFYVIRDGIGDGFFDVDDDGEGGEGTIVGDVTVEGGDTNNITINSSSSDKLLAASKALLSAVSIYAEFERSSMGTTQPFSQAGSGVIYKLDKEKGDAYIITNYHVIHSTKDNSETKISRNIDIYLYGMEAYEYTISAEFVGGSMKYDLAVLKVTGSRTLIESNAVAVSVADSNDVCVLDTAIAIGNPASGGISATVGYVNVDSEEIEILASDEKTPIELRVMRIDTAINSGNSGGGLFNDKGELIGIVNAKMTTNDNIGYAIPSNVAKYIAENVLYYCNGIDKTSVQRCILGITVSPDELYTVYDKESGKIHKYEKVKILETVANSLGARYFFAGDIIKSIVIDGEQYEVTRIFHVVDSMLNARIGSAVVFKIERGGTSIDVSFTVTSETLTEYK